MGNLGSVFNALEAVEADVHIASVPRDLAAASHIVLPGVGAFPDGMRQLASRGWIEVLAHEVIDAGKPFLGLCLGMQLLATKGEEHKSCDGLDWIPGRVLRMSPTDPDARVPHIGWNDVTIDPSSRLCAGMRDAETFYFVHSYVFEPEDQGVASGVCDYYGAFVAIVESGNVMATQFHPEKSQGPGLQILRNFCELQG